MVKVVDGAFLFAAQKIMRNAMAETAASDFPAVQSHDTGQHDEAAPQQPNPRKRTSRTGQVCRSRLGQAPRRCSDKRSRWARLFVYPVCLEKSARLQFRYQTNKGT